jgi:predicted O-methyltransferase YrrM
MGMVKAAEAGRARRVIGRAVSHPGWALTQARQVVERRREGRPMSLRDFERYVVPEEEAVMRVTGIDAGRYRELRDALWFPTPEPEQRTAWSSREVLLRVLGVTVRALRPEVMLETGVERGYSTAVTLAAMDANGVGSLHSIDLPPLEADGDFTGSAVPERLRSRWRLELGSSRTLLPRLVAELGSIDVFLHDADHTYRSQIDEYRTAWPAVREGGLLVSDDVWNTAFVDFAAEVGERPLLIRRWDDHDAVGLLQKAASTAQK